MNEEPNLFVLPVGARVLLSDEIPAVITRISIFGDMHSITYECDWWDGRTHQSGWFTPSQVRSLSDNLKLNIGFHPYV